MKLSVSSYSFSAAIRAGKMTQVDAVEQAAARGLDGVEFIELTPCENATYAQQQAAAHEIRTRAAAAGIEVNAYTVGANLWQPTPEANAAEVARVKRAVDLAAVMGAPLLRHDACWSLAATGAARSFDGMLPVIAANAREITAYAAEKGIRTCTENHGFIAQDSDRMERLFNAVAHDNYGLLLDLGNFTCADEDPAKAVSRLAPYAFHVHAKDMRFYPGGEGNPGGCIVTRGCNYLRPTWVGNGSVPVKQCLRILRHAGYDGWLSLEFEGGEDCFDGIDRGLATLRRYLKELEAE